MDNTLTPASQETTHKANGTTSTPLSPGEVLAISPATTSHETPSNDETLSDDGDEYNRLCVRRSALAVDIGQKKEVLKNCRNLVQCSKRKGVDSEAKLDALERELRDKESKKQRLMKKHHDVTAAFREEMRPLEGRLTKLNSYRLLGIFAHTTRW